MVERKSDLMNWRFDGRTSRFSLNRMVQPFVFLQHQNNVVLMLLESKWCYFDDFLKYLFLSRTPGSLPNFNSCRLLPTTPPPPTPVFDPTHAEHQRSLPPFPLPPLFLLPNAPCAATFLPFSFPMVSLPHFFRDFYFYFYLPCSLPLLFILFYILYFLILWFLKLVILI